MEHDASPTEQWLEEVLHAERSPQAPGAWPPGWEPFSSSDGRRSHGDGPEASSAMVKRHATFYEVLAVAPEASAEAVRKAYLKAALRWHPDKNPLDPEASAMFKRVAHAYKVLTDSLQSDGEGELAKDWWPDDPEASKDMAYQFFIHRVRGCSLKKGFSEAKLREIFPQLFGPLKHLSAL